MTETTTKNQIVTAPDGTRYCRTLSWQTIAPEQPYCDQSMRFAVNTKTYDGAPCDTAGYALVELPRIPNWPLPGPAPQYLHHGGDIEVGEGDTWVFQEHLTGSWCIINNTVAGGHMAGRANSADCWLISRADPRADA